MNSGARGSAILAALAAGPDLSGYGDAPSAVRALGDRGERVFRPHPARMRSYDGLYKTYDALYTHFGEGPGTEQLHRLHRIQQGEAVD